MLYNEHTNTYLKCNEILKLSDQYNLQVSNYIFQSLHSNIDEEIESSLLVNNQIHSHNTRSNNRMSILRMNRSNTKYSVLHNGMITWNYLTWYIKSQHIIFGFLERGTKFSSVFIFVKYCAWATLKFDYIYCFSRVIIVSGFTG